MEGMDINLADRTQVDIDVKYMFSIQDKMFKPNEVVVYAKKHCTDCDGEIETWCKVITVDETGNARKYIKDLYPTPSGWFKVYMH